MTEPDHLAAVLGRDPDHVAVALARAYQEGYADGYQDGHRDALDEDDWEPDQDARGTTDVPTGDYL